MEKLYQLYSLVWNDEYNDVDCQEQIEERISEFQKILTNLAELRVPGKIKNISNNKIEATGAAETKQKDISVSAYNRNWAYTGAEFDESKGVYIWNYTIEPNFIMSCEDQDLLFLLRAIKEDAKFFTNENILKAISAYIRVLGNEYQFIYDKTKKGTINEWLEQQKVTYEGTIVNVTKTNAKSKEELLSQLTKFKKHLLEKYEKEGINPEDCKVSKVEEKWYLIISTTNEKIELNENYSIICEKIASIQSILISIDAQDYTESVVSKENSTLMNHNISEAVDDIAKSYVYLK